MRILVVEDEKKTAAFLACLAPATALAQQSEGNSVVIGPVDVGPQAAPQAATQPAPQAPPPPVETKPATPEQVTPSMTSPTPIGRQSQNNAAPATTPNSGSSASVEIPPAPAPVPGAARCCGRPPAPGE